MLIDLIVIAALAVVMVGVACSEPLRQRSRRAWALSTAAHWVALGATAAGSLVLAEKWWLFGVAVAIFGPWAITHVAGPGLRGDLDWRVKWAATSVPFLALAFASWLRGRGYAPDPGVATAVASGAFVVIVTEGLVKRYDDLKAVEAAYSASEETPAPAGELWIRAYGASVWVELIGFGLPAALAVIRLWGGAARAVGFDRDTSNTLAVEVLAGGIAVAVAVAATAFVVAGSKRRPLDPCDPELQPSTSTVVLLIVAAAIFGVTPWKLGGDLHYWCASLALALGCGVVAFINLKDNVASLHVARMGRNALVIAVTCAVGVSSATFWLFSAGLWSDRAAAPVEAATNASVIVIVGVGLLVLMSGAAMARQLRGAELTLHHPAQNLLQDQLIYAALGLGFLATPVYAFAELRSQTLALVANFAAGLGGTAALGILMAGRVTRNNDEHLEREQRRLPAAVARRAGLCANEVAALNGDRKARLARHVKVQAVTFGFFAVAAVLIVGVHFFFWPNI